MNRPLVVLVAGLLACGCAIHGKRRESNAEAILVSFGGTQGQYTDDGSHSPGGGLARQRTVVDSLVADGKDFALLDLGDFMSMNNLVGEMETRFIWEQMEHLGYLATTPGAREVTNWRLYEDLLRGSAIRCVSSNLTVLEKGKHRPAGLRTLVAEVGGVRFGFFGLMGDAVLMSARPPEGIEFGLADPTSTARQIVPELRRRAEVIVLLSQLPSEETDFLIKQVPGIDVALYGRLPYWNDEARLNGRTITQQTGTRGCFVGRLMLVVGPDGRIIDWGSRNERMYKNVPENADVLAAVKQLDTAVRSKIKEAHRRDLLRDPGD